MRSRGIGSGRPVHGGRAGALARECGSGAGSGGCELREAMERATAEIAHVREAAASEADERSRAAEAELERSLGCYARSWKGSNRAG